MEDKIIKLRESLDKINFFERKDILKFPEFYEFVDCKYIDNKNLETGIMKINDNLVGFYEQEFHKDKNEMELIQMGILKEYQGQKLGSFLLKYIINNAFSENVERLWVHTCSLDHKYALNNYLSKGLNVFKEEEIDFFF